MSQSTLRIQNFKMGPLEDFEKKKVQGWENHFRVAKIGFSETIFPTDWRYIGSEKSGFRFSFGAPRVPEPKDQIQRLQLQNLNQNPASKFLSKLHFQRQYHSSIKWVSLYWNENDRTLVQKKLYEKCKSEYFLYLGRKLTTCSQHLKMWSLILNFPSSWHANHNFD